MADYDQVFSQLTRGKTHGVKDRLAKTAQAREFLLRRKAEIADYLNWYEATKLDPSKHAFEGYLKTARELSVPLEHHDPISKYLDEVAAKTKK